MQDLVITIIQSDLVWEKVDQNLENFTSKIESLESIPDVIILPEMFNTGFVMDAEKVAETISGPTIKWMSEMASKYSCVITGSVGIYDNGKFYNRFIWMQQDGFFNTYDKRHLFTMGGENDHYTHGENQLVISYKGWKIKPIICYDLRFPVWIKNNLKDEVYDYDLLINVANWPKVRNQVWNSLLTARAIENQCYVIGVNRIGPDGNGLEHCGASQILNARGEQMGTIENDTEGTLTMNLSLDELIEFREKFTVGEDWDSFELIK